MNVTSQNICPACGYNLGFPAWDEESPSDEICPSCGIQFGYDDAAGGRWENRQNVYKGWRRRWIKNGCPWSSTGIRPPVDWDPCLQMKLAGINDTCAPSVPSKEE